LGRDPDRRFRTRHVLRVHVGGVLGPDPPAAARGLGPEVAPANGDRTGNGLVLQEQAFQRPAGRDAADVLADFDTNRLSGLEVDTHDSVLPSLSKVRAGSIAISTLEARRGG